MSANRWSRCIRCHARALARFEKDEQLIEAAYGNVSIAAFDQMRDNLDQDREDEEKSKETFREDWRVSDVSDGVLNFHYEGSCGTCGLTLKVNEDWEVPNVDK